MLNALRKLFFSSQKKVSNSFLAKVAPKEPIFVIGDVHGRADLLLRLLDKAPKNVQKVFVGDLIDRGENSAEVLSIVRNLCDVGAISLMGNHEKMMLDFLDRPENHSQNWMRNGGIKTLFSFKVYLPDKELNAPILNQIKRDL